MGKVAGQRLWADQIGRCFMTSLLNVAILFTANLAVSMAPRDYRLLFRSLYVSIQSRVFSYFICHTYLITIIIVHNIFSPLHCTMNDLVCSSIQVFA